MGLAALAISCSSTNDDEPRTQAAGATSWSEEQAAEMSDGAVSQTEYHAAFDRFEACVRDAGYGLVNVVDRGVRIDYAFPASATALADECYEREFSAVDESWQVNNPDPVMVEMFSSCLRKLGYPVPKTYDEMGRMIVVEDIDPVVCIDN